MICDKLQECIEKQFAGEQISECANHNVSECIEASDRRSKLKCEEKGKKYILENTEENHVISYKMDGGIIRLDESVPEGTCKCDYLFLTNGSEHIAILIELKGVNVTYALEQIHGTLQLFQNFFKTCSRVYGRVIVTSSVPNLKANPKYVNLERMLRQTFGGNIKIWERQHSEKDIELSNKQ